MLDLNTLTTFLGWSSVINLVFFIFAAIILVLFKNCAASFHSKLFDLDEAAIKISYFDYLGRYKIAILICNIVPYLALKLML